ncbi:hypothetical protein SAY87_001292 [Trapa incisa]|uniref:Alpha/beta hydrolase fold-3 domain-containing protein n=1 Tax=Trapa incisa TaxID=236973 RepID=A0AAN7GDD9_9MYRT|nr:hypothetical protein SAY87_001292 [Trapa incisa]
MAAMTSLDGEILHEFPFFRVYKDGRIHLLTPPIEKISPSEDLATGLRSKDAVISTDPPVHARIFIPKAAASDHSCPKLPLLFYLHGGGFCIQSAFSRQHHGFASIMAAEAGCVVVSVEYGLFPDRPLPGCYDDSWAALEWVAAKQDPWIAEHADLGRVFVVGNSAGANISHTLAARIGSVGLPGIKVVGVVLVHPYFGGTNDDRMWFYMCPSNSGPEDPRLKPAAADLARLGCERVLVFVAERDHLMEVGVRYVEKLKKSGWRGAVELVINEGEGHCFYLSDPTSQDAVQLKDKLVSFIKQA